MNHVELAFHGAGQEVGRSAIVARFGGEAVLLDCGIQLAPEGEILPKSLLQEEVGNLSAAILTHAHADHVGAIADLVKAGYYSPILATIVTRLLTSILLHDGLKQAKRRKVAHRYSWGEMAKVDRLMKHQDEATFGEIGVRLVPNGHIPGSRAAFIRWRDRTVLYTGDINDQATRLMDAPGPMPKADILVVEATYGGRLHGDRSDQEGRLGTIVEETLAQGGSVLIPVFAIGKAQEVLLAMDAHGVDCPVFLDGMVVDVSKFLSSRIFSGNERLIQPLKRVGMLSRPEDRAKAVERGGVFLASGGMLAGGASIQYLQHFLGRPECTIVLAGYQARGTPGRRLLETRRMKLDTGEEVSAACDVHQLSFSAHADFAGLQSIIRQVDPRKVVVNHGDPESCAAVADYARSLGKEAVIPVTGEKVRV